MTVEEIFDQAIVMLQRQRRAADRTLQGPFSSDDNTLEALQDARLPCPGSGSQPQRLRRPAGVTHAHRMALCQDFLTPRRGG
jgi:hypothetical protein